MVADAGNVVEEMFEDLYARLLDDLLHGDESSPVFCHHAASLAAKSRSVSMEDYLAGEPNQIVVDYLASMTDSYFMALYGHLFPRSKQAHHHARLLLRFRPRAHRGKETPS